MTKPSSVPGAPTTRRHLALWFPFLSVDRLRRAIRSAVPDEAPLALIENARGVIRLAASDPRALTLGLTPGLTLADARARVPDLVAFDHDSSADRRWLERLADICDRYTPMVALDPPDGLTLDITGCAHLFGGEAGLVIDVKARLRRWTDHLRHAFADTPEGAQALARFQAEPMADEETALHHLPIAALRLPVETEIALHRTGLKLIGDLAARPTAPVTARFGGEVAAMLARVLGRADSRITPRRIPPALSFERRFADPIAHAEAALSVIDELAREAAQALERRQKGGRRFVARLFRSDGIVRDLIVETGLPLRDSVALMRLFRERIDTLSDPLDPGFGFDLIRLTVPMIEPLAPAQLQLEGNAIGKEAVAALIDRLSTRFGHVRIRQFAPRDTHIPERAVLTLPAVDMPTTVAWVRLETGEPPARPLALFDPPQRIDVIAEVPDGPPRRFRWRSGVHEVVRSEGPERIAAEWWHAKGAGITRDYYRLEDAGGRRFWVFRHGLYDSEKAAPRWYVHGLFA